MWCESRLGKMSNQKVEREKEGGLGTKLGSEGECVRKKMKERRINVAMIVMTRMMKTSMWKWNENWTVVGLKAVAELKLIL